MKVFWRCWTAAGDNSDIDYYSVIAKECKKILQLYSDMSNSFVVFSVAGV